MRNIEHANIVAYKGCYLDGIEVWLALEFCLGSALDVMEAIKTGLSEPQILGITSAVLKALEYLHNQEKMHRDVKAGNILLAQNAEVKLADFGSASTKVKANSFSGTPFWMAPEMIMAMETGTYTCAIDLWSLGITCIELANTQPPLFNMNAMSALYHIPQRDPPKLEGAEWSDLFKDFIACCLQKDPDSRGTATVLLQHPFIQQPQTSSVLEELLKTATNPELVEGNRRHLAESLDQIRQHIRDSSPESSPRETPTTSPMTSPSASRKSPTSTDLKRGLATVTEAADTPLPSIRGQPTNDATQGVVAGTAKGKRGGDIASISGGSMLIAQDNAIPGPPAGSISPQRKLKKKKKKTSGPLQEARSKRYETQKTAMESQLIVAQLKQIKKVRKEQAKLIEALDTKHAQERSKLESKQTKELDQTTKTQDKEMERCKGKWKAEMDAFKKEDATENQKAVKRAKQFREKNISEFVKSCAASLKTAMMALRADAVNATKVERKGLEQSLKEHHDEQRVSNEKALLVRLNDEAEKTETKFKHDRIILLHKLEATQLNEEEAMVVKQSKQLSVIRTSHYHVNITCIQTQHSERAKVLVENLSILSQNELEQADNLARDGLKDVEKSHLAQLNGAPSNFKEISSRLQKQFKSTIKVAEKEYRSSFGELQRVTPSTERTDTLKRHTTEKTQTLAKLETEYRASVTDMKRDATESMAQRHAEEMAKLRADHGAAKVDLESYQKARGGVHKQQAKDAESDLKITIKQMNEACKLVASREDERCAKMKSKVQELATRQDDQIRNAFKSALSFQ
jgi:thousand and one amino acid protein kinase